ncbi:MAG: DUF2854 domain-containing protein, partial [Dolichospermum sp.]
YTLILEFDSPLISFDTWQQKQEKMTKYFGPNVEISMTQPKEDYIELSLMKQE